jgi:hypothetical protein
LRRNPEEADRPAVSFPLSSVVRVFKLDQSIKAGKSHADQQQPNHKGNDKHIIAYTESDPLPASVGMHDTKAMML